MFMLRGDQFHSNGKQRESEFIIEKDLITVFALFNYFIHKRNKRPFIFNLLKY